MPTFERHTLGSFCVFHHCFSSKYLSLKNSLQVSYYETYKFIYRTQNYRVMPVNGSESLIMARKTKGPKRRPCGTPVCIIDLSDRTNL